MEIITEDELVAAVEAGTLIKNGKKESCEGIKYDFILSKMVLTAETQRPQDIDNSKEGAVIKPGEVAFVMTEETLDLPDDIYCQLSTKRKLSLDGIVILGGLIIDPNYKGKLIFGLYNLSSRAYPLLPGKKLVAGVFYKVNKKSDKIPAPIHSFPDDLIKAVVDSKPNSITTVNTIISSMDNVINALRIEIQDIKKKLDHDDKWKVDFQAGLTEIKQLVKTIGEKLGDEIDTRQHEIHDVKNEQIKLKEQIIPLSRAQKIMQVLGGVLIGIVIGVIVSLITQFINN